MISWQPFPTDPTVSERACLPSLPRHVDIPKVAKIDTLRMIIFKDKDIQFSYEEGEAFVYKKYVIESGKGQRFVDTSLDVFTGGLEVTAKKLEIFIQGDRRFQRFVPLARLVQQQLWDFVLQGPPSHTFCCGDFVQKLFDKYVLQFPHRFNTGEWKFICCTRKKQPKAGDAVALSEGRSTELLRHFAFCLGHGLYLSVAGDGGPLVVTELKELKNLYQASTVFVIFPKKGTKGQPEPGA